MKKYIISFLCCIVLCFSPLHSSFAETNESYVSTDTTLTKTTFMAGDEVIIDGVIQGDLYSAARKIVVNGQIEGDVIGAAQEIEINGTVNGDIRTAAQNVNIAGEVKGNVLSFAEGITVNGTVLGDIVTFAESLSIQTEVKKSIIGAMELLTLHENVQGDVTLLGVGEIVLKNDSRIQGDVSYRATSEITMLQDRVDGEVTFKQEQLQSQTQTNNTILPFLQTVLSALLLYGVVRLIATKTIVHAKHHVLKNGGNKALKGFILLVVTPIIAFFLLFTIVGISISFALTGIIIILLYMSKLFVGVAMGEWMMKRVKVTVHPIIREVLGVLLFVLLTQIPFIGGIVSFVAVILFLGYVWSTIREERTLLE